MKRHALFMSLWLAMLAQVASATPAAGLKAGAAKLDITPTSDRLLPGDSIRDPLSVRAIVLRNGTNCAVLVGVDQAGFFSVRIQDVIAHASKVTGCSPENFVVSATHTHSGSTRSLLDPTGQPQATKVEDAIFAAIIKASNSLRPARVGFGETKLDINVNRDAWINGQWMQASNPAGPSDKTLAVVEFVDASNHPIAAYMNYAMHPINFYLSGVISADVPGEVSRYVESQFDPEMVAIFAQGAAGDQNPALTTPVLNLIANRTSGSTRQDRTVARTDPWVELATERNGNARLSAALAKPVPDDQRADYRAAIARSSELVRAEGVLMGEKVIETMRFGIANLDAEAVPVGFSTSLQCPGRDRLDRADPVREGSAPPYADGAPVVMREGVLRIGSVYILSVDGEVYSEIASELKEKAGDHHVIFTTLANGMANSGYIYSDNARDHLTFQVIDSRLKAGCAQGKIVAAGMDLIQRAEQGK